MSWATVPLTSFDQQAPLVTFDNEAALKTQFADAWLRNPTNPFTAALTIFIADTGRALFVANNWVRDEFVHAEKKRLVAEFGAKHFLPTKEDVAREIWDDGQTQRNGNKLAHYVEYSKLMGFIEKPAEPNINVNVGIDQRKVMIVKDHGSNDEWAEKLIQQQQALIGQSQQLNDATSTNDMATDPE